jgi:hypothetical protein
MYSLPSLTAGLTDGKKESIADNLSQWCHGLISFALHRATPEHLSGSSSAPKNAHQTSGEIGKTFDDSAQKPRRAKAPQDSSSAPSLPGTVGHAPGYAVPPGGFPAFAGHDGAFPSLDGPSGVFSGYANSLRAAKDLLDLRVSSLDSLSLRARSDWLDLLVY